MARSKPISFIPTSINFSEMGEGKDDFDIEDVLPAKEDDRSGLWVESIILAMLEGLSSDRERVILLLQIMRGDGYNFDQKSIAKLFGVQVRWYFRICRGMRRKLQELNLC